MTSLSKLAFKHFVSISFYARGNIIQMMRTRARDEDVMVLIENNLREHLHHFSNEYVRGKCLIKYYKMFTQRMQSIFKSCHQCPKNALLKLYLPRCKCRQNFIFKVSNKLLCYGYMKLRLYD